MKTSENIRKHPKQAQKLNENLNTGGSSAAGGALWVLSVMLVNNDAKEMLVASTRTMEADGDMWWRMQHSNLKDLILHEIYLSSRVNINVMYIIYILCVHIDINTKIN